MQEDTGNGTSTGGASQRHQQAHAHPAVVARHVDLHARDGQPAGGPVSRERG